MILAAGLGTRLRPITDLVPKPLSPVGNVPVLRRQLDALAAIGVRRVVVNASHLAAQIEAFVGDGSTWGLEVIISPEREPAGTGGGIARARPYLQDEPEFLVVNADVVHGYDLRAIAARRRESGADAVAVIRRTGVRFPSAVGVDGTGRVVYVPGLETPAGEPVDFAGIHVLTPAIFEHLRPTGSIFLDGYAPLMRSGGLVVAYEDADAAWFDVGSPAGLLEANFAAARANHRPPPDVTREAHADITPPVLIAEDAILASGCAIGPDVVVGSRARIGAGARLRRSVIWPATEVPAAATLDGAIAYPGGILVADELRRPA
jgi:mannose-1-phosphate guanylyltransferase